MATTTDHRIGAIVSQATWEVIHRVAAASPRFPGLPQAGSLDRLVAEAEVPPKVEILVVDLAAYRTLPHLGTDYRNFRRRVLFVAATPQEELGLLEFIDSADDLVRADALEGQLVIRLERLLAAPRMTRLDSFTGSRTAGSSTSTPRRP